MTPFAGLAERSLPIFMGGGEDECKYLPANGDPGDENPP